MSLTAVVIGAGWAGEGHTRALRAAGVEVVAMCGRTPEPVRAMADSLGISRVLFDWQQALADLRPDIVAIATPAGPHCAMAQAAASLGCHILCDKPLAVNADEARRMLMAVERGAVKHAYAATSRYAPALAYARALLAEGLIGPLTGIESVIHYNISPLTTYSWFHQRSQGGGLLNNIFTHKLAQVLHLTGGSVYAAGGEAHALFDRAPIGPAIHDFRDNFSPKAVIKQPQAEAGAWGGVDADMAYTVIAQIDLPAGGQVSAVFQASAIATSPFPGYLALYATRGALCLTGRNSPDHLQHFDNERQTWVDLAVPAEILARQPQLDDPVQRDWNHLAREFVADIRGEGYAGYPTFHDGWVAAEFMDIVRSGQGWTVLPKRPEAGGG